MCGLAGIALIGHDSRHGLPDRDGLIERMCASVAHRGPDGTSISVNQGNVRLGFTRLALVGLSNGQQPLETTDGDLMIIANGEVYNHRDLEQELGNPELRTDSDCEVLLHLYRRDGQRFLERVRGMVAAVVWDRRRNLLVLARDPLGIKPLFFHQNAERVLIASQTTALFKDPRTPRRVDWVGALADQLLTSSTRLTDAPLTSWFEDIHLVGPGQVITIDLGTGRRTEQTFWHLPAERDDDISPAEYVAEYRSRLERAVRDCASADVPVGLFLSGGVDSAAVAALSGRSHETYSALNPSTLSNGDVDGAIAVSRLLGLPNHQVIFRADDVPSSQAWLRFLWQVESPVAGPESFYKGELYRYAASATPHVKAMMLGGGADEFNGGYSTTIGGEGGWSAFELGLGELRDGTAAAFDLARREWSPTGRPLVRGAALTGIAQLAVDDPYRAFLTSKYRDVCLYNLWHEDRTAAGSGIEARVPFLDHTVVEWSVAIPRALRAELLWDKALLRRAVADVLPPEVANRPKVPFFYGPGVQHTYRAFGEMLRAEKGALVERALAAPGAGEVFDLDALRDVALGITSSSPPGHLELVLKLINLGLLQDMACSPPLDHAVSTAAPVPLAGAAVDLVTPSSLRLAVGLADPLAPASVLSFAAGALLLQDQTGLAWYVAINGQIEFVMDSVEDAEWVDILTRIDGRGSVGDLFTRGELEKVLPLVLQSIDAGLLEVSAALEDDPSSRRSVAAVA